MRSSDIPNADLTLNVQETQDINQLIQDYIEHLAELTPQTQSPLKECLIDFLEKTKSLLSSITTAGATHETVLKDLVSVIKVITQPTAQNIVDLFERWNTHTNAYSIRKKVGIPSAIGGLGASIAAGILFFTTSPFSTPVLITAGVIGLGVGVFSTGVVIDGSRKRTTIAECLQDILDCTYKNLLTNKKYAEFTCAKLAIIKLIAQGKSDNERRDFAIDIVTGLIIKANDLGVIATKLSELNSNLRGIYSNSETASLVDELIKEINTFKESLDNKISGHNPGTSFNL